MIHDRISTAGQADPALPARIPISLVDDDVDLRRALQLLLRAANYDVRAYARAGAMLADARSHSIACLVADLTMPDMDGFTLLRRLRLAGWSGPAILITASLEAGLPERAAGAGFQTVLRKPLADRIMLAAVSSAVRLNPAVQPGVAR